MQYSLMTEWHLDAPIEQVWNVLIATEAWSKWWHFIKEVVEINEGDAQGLNSVRRFTWTTRLPYRLCFEVRVKMLDKPYRIEGIASGDLNGTGSWKLDDLGDSTRVTYVWKVSTKKAWMNFLAPILAPVFIWNHNQVMREGGKGMARYLGVSLLDFRSSRSYRKEWI